MADPCDECHSDPHRLDCSRGRRIRAMPAEQLKAVTAGDGRIDWRARCLAAESERDRLRAVAVEALDRAHHDDRCNRIMGWGNDCPCDCRVRDLRAAIKETP